MGWGLRSKAPVSAGSLVIEYLGEIIDFAEVQRRMTQQCQERPSDKDYYIMELDTDLYVDGKYKGNTSRYINHSCDPNCELQRWVVNGLMRIGIFAIRDIQPDEALSYDYQFDTNEADTFRCYCGADICRGTMAPRKKTDRRIDHARLLLLAEEGGLSLATKAERDILIEAGRLQERMLSDLARAESEWSRSYTGKVLPGEVISEVKNGPLKSSLQMGRFCGNVLVRNVNKSRNLLKRHLRLQSKRTGAVKVEEGSQK